jgi:hypothetical protein
MVVYFNFYHDSLSSSCEIVLSLKKYNFFIDIVWRFRYHGGYIYSYLRWIITVCNSGCWFMARYLIFCCVSGIYCSEKLIIINFIQIWGCQCSFLYFWSASTEWYQWVTLSHKHLTFDSFGYKFWLFLIILKVVIFNKML